MKITKRDNGALLFEDDFSSMPQTIDNISKLSEEGKIVNLREACFRDTDFAYRAFKNIDFDFSLFENCDIAGAHFIDCSFKEAEFRNCTLIRARFINCTIDKISFLKCEVTDVDFDSHCENVKFVHSDLVYASFRRMLSGNFEFCDLYHAKLPEDIQLKYFNFCNMLDVSGPEIKSPGYAELLMNQKGPLVGYKLVNYQFEGIFYGGLKFKIGTEVVENNCNYSIFEHCGAGINLASLEWCLREQERTYGAIILECEFMPEDVVAFPINSDGKFRVKRCKVIKKYQE